MEKNSVLDAIHKRRSTRFFLRCGDLIDQIRSKP